MSDRSYLLYLTDVQDSGRAIQSHIGKLEFVR